MLLRAMHICGAGATHPGRRATNEDALLVEADLGLFAVLDGMGGAAAGEIAAQLAGEALICFARKHLTNTRVPARELLELAIDCAAAAVYLAGKHRPELSGMGTTVVACLSLTPTSVVIGHVGDSRAYLLRDDHLQVLTRDHTVAQELVDSGRLSTDAMLSNFKHMLTRNLGNEDGVQAEMLELTLQSGDRILLCSDGLHGCLSLADLQRALSSNASPQEIAQALIDAALISGEATDNISAVVLASLDEVDESTDRVQVLTDQETLACG
jgi:serine/threonine protein phosphatase PrpC